MLDSKVVLISMALMIAYIYITNDSYIIIESEKENEDYLFK